MFNTTTAFQNQFHSIILIDFCVGLFFALLYKCSNKSYQVDPCQKRGKDDNFEWEYFENNSENFDGLAVYFGTAISNLISNKHHIRLFTLWLLGTLVSIIKQLKAHIYDTVKLK